jgi:RNA polymerase sigma-70 factor (ECF subfamily)
MSTAPPSTGAQAGPLEDPDAALLARVAQGEEAAMRILVAAKLPRIHALALRQLGRNAEADDIAQDAFLRVWRQARKWRPGPARFDTWLHRVVLNLCTDRLRRRREIPVAEPPEQVDPVPGADRRIEGQEMTQQVQAALARLPPRQREAIVLHTYQDMSNIEIARILHISVEALESLLSRARRALRSSLLEIGIEGSGL